MHRQWPDGGSSAGRKEGGASPNWAGRGAAYHEAVAALVDGRAEVWDATVNARLSPNHVRGVRSILGVRIGGADTTGEVALWRGVEVQLGEWIAPERAVKVRSDSELTEA